MPGKSRKKYTAEEQERYDAAYKRLLRMIETAAADADAESFRRTLNEELAAGFPVDWQDSEGWTLLRWAGSVNSISCIEILASAGAEMDVRDKFGWDAFSSVFFSYVYYGGTPDDDIRKFAVIRALLAGGASGEVPENIKIWEDPKKKKRCALLLAYAEKTARAKKDAAPGFDYEL